MNRERKRKREMERGGRGGGDGGERTHRVLTTIELVTYRYYLEVSIFYFLKFKLQKYHDVLKTTTLYIHTVHVEYIFVLFLRSFRN